MSVYSAAIQFLRRLTGAVGAPTTLLAGQPFFNEVESTLYIGTGNDGLGNSLNQVPIAGPGVFGRLDAGYDTLALTPAAQVKVGTVALIGDLKNPNYHPLDASRFKQGINSVVSVAASVAPTAVDAMEQAVVQPNHGDTTNLVFNGMWAPVGGALEQLTTAWLTGTLGQSASTAASTIASIRAAALAITA